MDLTPTWILKASQEPSKGLPRGFRNHLPTIFNSWMGFHSILHRFCINLLTILETFWDPKSCRKSDHDYVTFCYWFVALFCAFACITNSCKPAKKHSKTYGFYTFALTLSLRSSRSYRQQESRKSHQKTSIFWLKNLIKSNRNRNQIWSSISDPFWQLFLTIWGASGDPFGRLGGAFGRPWALIGVSFALSWRILEPCWSLLAILWAILSLQSSF